jgi:hypothetical protein
MPAPASMPTSGPGTPSSAKLGCRVATPARRREGPASRGARLCCAGADCAGLDRVSGRAEDPRFTRRRPRRRACLVSVSAMVKGSLSDRDGRISKATTCDPWKPARSRSEVRPARLDGTPHDVPCTRSLPHAAARPRRAGQQCNRSRGGEPAGSRELIRPGHRKHVLRVALVQACEHAAGAPPFAAQQFPH